MFIAVASLIIALGVPVDTHTWDSSLGMIHGNLPMLRLIEASVFLITSISFFIAARKRGTREFFFIGTGSFLIFIGRNILLSADTWVGLPVGFLLLAAGTWLACKNLHKIYLWL